MGAPGRRLCVTLIAIALAGSACDQSAPRAQPVAEADTVARWTLPKRLREISGLALTADDRLFAHNDERAFVYQIDWQQGRIVKAFAVGDPAIRGDFEEIAIAGVDFYLITSDGVLYRFREGADGEHVAFEQFDTGLSARCEIEGLTYDGRRDVLLAACKTPRDKALKGRVAVFAWSPQTRAVVPGASFEIPARALSGPIGADHFNPSAATLSRDGTRLWLLAGRERALAQVDLTGAVVSVTRLDPAKHRQPEGLAIAAGGEMIIADEGAEGSATLAVYKPR
jgi:uncharacterized protein YjiK